MKNTCVTGLIVVLFLIASIISPNVLSLPGRNYSGSFKNSSFNSSEIREIRLTYMFEQPRIIPMESSFHRVEIDGLSHFGHPGEPDLPTQGFNVFIPENKVVVGVTVEGEQVLVSENVFVVPAHKEVPISQWYTAAESPTPDPEIYYSSEPFPSNPVESVGTFGYHGAAIFVARVCPLVFIPNTGSLYFYESLEVRIHLEENSGGNRFEDSYRGLPEDAEKIKAKADNPDYVTDYFVVSPPHSLEVNKERYDLLIITTEELRSGFVPLAQSHIRDGIRTTIRTLGRDIPFGVDYDDTCTKIRDYIRDAYHNWHIEYVLLGGDEDIVPARQLFFGTYQGRQVFGPSDLYYAGLDGCFDANGNGIYGEYPADQVDFLAEVYVGRACVGDLTEVRHFVDKTLWYKTIDVLSSKVDEVPYVNRVLLIGEKLNDLPTWGCCYMDELIDSSDANGFVTMGIPSEQYHIDTLYDRDWEDPVHRWPKQEIIDRINSGVHIINHLGHAGPYTSMKLNVGMGDIDLLTNRELCFIYSQSCSAGAFDKDSYNYSNPDTPIPDCIAEHLTVKTPHGAFAGIWNAREGWYQSGGTNSSSQRFNREFWNIVFEEGKSVISVAHQKAKEQCLHLISAFGFHRYRWVYYSLNYLGDPTISFRNRPLYADAHGPYEALENEPVSFSGSAYGGMRPYRWYWDFGDGNTSTLKNPVHSYSSYGLKNVTLTVTDARGAQSSDQTTVRVPSSVVWVDDDYCEECDNDGRIWNETAFNTIQAGIDAVEENGIVYVASGTYVENVRISKTIILVGEHKFSTVIDGASSGDVIHVSSSGVHISGFTIQNSSSSTSGVVVIGNNVNTTTITNNIIRNNDQNIRLFGSSYNKICGNILTNSYYSLIAHSSSHNIITGNVITESSGCGITLLSSSYNIIAGNSITENYGTGIWLLSSSNNNSITDNIITDNNGGISLYFSTQDNNITANSIQNNGIGISLSGSVDNSIIENGIINNGVGVLLESSANRNLIIGNTVEDNHNAGIKIVSSSSGNHIRDNNILNNREGIYLWHFANNNFVIENMVESNQVGIVVGFVCFLNRIYHNNFNNSQNAYVDDTYLLPNFWNHTDPLIGGNYWNDWEDNQGYFDYYFINEDNIDYHPFHEPKEWM